MSCQSKNKKFKNTLIKEAIYNKAENIFEQKRLKMQMKSVIDRNHNLVIISQQSMQLISKGMTIPKIGLFQRAMKPRI